MHFGHFEITFGFIIVDFVFWTPFLGLIYGPFLPLKAPIAQLLSTYTSWLSLSGSKQVLVPNYSFLEP